MATSIHLNFGDFVFSSAVERITVQTSAASVDISLHILSGTDPHLFSPKPTTHIPAPSRSTTSPP